MALQKRFQGHTMTKREGFEQTDPREEGSWVETLLFPSFWLCSTCCHLPNSCSRTGPSSHPWLKRKCQESSFATSSQASLIAILGQVWLHVAQGLQVRHWTFLQALVYESSCCYGASIFWRSAGWDLVSNGRYCAPCILTLVFSVLLYFFSFSTLGVYLKHGRVADPRSGAEELSAEWSYETIGTHP